MDILFSACLLLSAIWGLYTHGWQRRNWLTSLELFSLVLADCVGCHLSFVGFFTCKLLVSALESFPSPPWIYEWRYTFAFSIGGSDLFSFPDLMEKILQGGKCHDSALSRIDESSSDRFFSYSVLSCLQCEVWILSLFLVVLCWYCPQDIIVPAFDILLLLLSVLKTRNRRRTAQKKHPSLINSLLLLVLCIVYKRFFPDQLPIQFTLLIAVSGILSSSKSGPDVIRRHALDQKEE